MESLFLEIKCKNFQTIVGNIYRPPGSGVFGLTPNQQTLNAIEIIGDIIDKISSQGKKCFIVGDLNLCLLNFDSNQFSSNLIDLMFSHGFLSLLKFPTRISHNSASLIDHLWTNMQSENYLSGIITSYISDHFPVFTFIDQSKPENIPKSFRCRDFSQANIDSFKENLEQLSFNDVYIEEEAQKSYDSFHNQFFALFDAQFPVKTVKFNKNFHRIEKWMTKGLLKSRQTKIKLAKKRAKNPSQHNKSKFVKYKNLYNTLLRAMKKKYYNERLIKCQGDLKKSWETVREAAGVKRKKSSMTDKLISAGNIISGDKDLAESFNLHFSNIATKIQDSIIPTTQQPDLYLEETEFNFEMPSLTINMTNYQDLSKTHGILEGKEMWDTT